MAAYARIYGFRTFSKKEISGNEDEFTWLEHDCYIANGEYEMLEEILEKEL